jgi:hypothetical protein
LNHSGNKTAQIKNGKKEKELTPKNQKRKKRE